MLTNKLFLFSTFWLYPFHRLPFFCYAISVHTSMEHHMNQAAAHRTLSVLEPFRTHPTPMLLAERDTGSILEGNDALLRLFRLNRGDLPGASFFSFGRLSARDMEAFSSSPAPGTLRMHCCTEGECANEYHVACDPFGPEGQLLLCTLTSISDICLSDANTGPEPNHCLMSGNIPAVLFQAMVDNGKVSLTFITSNVKDVFGVDRETVMRDASILPVHDDDREALLRSITEAARTETSWRHECRAVKPDGSVIWWRGEANLYMTSGTRAFFNGLILDITGEKDVEEALRRQARLLQAVSDTSALLLDTTPTSEKVQSCLAMVGIRLRVQRTCLYEISYSHETGESYFSLLDRWSERSEWQHPPREELQDIPFKAALSRWYEHFRCMRPVRGNINDFPRQEQEMLASFGATSLMAVPIMRSGSCWGFLCLNDMDRTRTWCDDEAAAAAAVGNALAGAVELGKTLERLKETETLYRSIFEDSPAGIFQADANGVYIRMNQAMARMHGYDSPADMMDRAQMGLQDVYAEPGNAESFLQALRDRATIEDQEVLARRKDGTTFWTSRTIHPMVDEYGEVISLDGFVVDITERKKLERLREEMDQITRHDLKTPLAGFISVPQVLLMSENLTEEQRELVGAMLDSGRRMLRLINISLDLYKLEQGTYQLQPTDVDLLQLAEGLSYELRHMCSDQKKTLLVLVHGVHPAKGASFMVSGEELLLYSMLANLLKNALEASPRGATVTMDLTRQAGGSRIDICNVGAVPEEIRETFFDKLTTSGKSGGTGLGTYSARLLAEAHGGSITMRTSEEAGTTVSIFLPTGIPKQP